MDKNFSDLLIDFKRISNKGLIVSDSKLKNGAGITLEKELGHTGGDFCYPDYNGIEIKAIRNYPDATIDLFSSTPDSNHLLTIQWLTEKYGYPDKTFLNKKCLKGDVFCGKANQIGRNYRFRIRIDRDCNKMFLQIYTRGGKFLNEDVYWHFQDIEKRVELKINKMAVITHQRYTQNDVCYYTYDKIELYKLKSFENFIDMIEKDIICISFKTGYYKSGNYIGKFHDHGTSFKINKNNLKYVFDKIY